MDFNDLKVILGVFHDAESIYDTFRAITNSFFKKTAVQRVEKCRMLKTIIKT